MSAMKDAGAAAFFMKESSVEQLYETIGVAINWKVVMRLA